MRRRMMFRVLGVCSAIGLAPGFLGGCGDASAPGEAVGEARAALAGWNVTVASSGVAQLTIYTGLGVAACPTGTACTSPSATYAHELRRYLDRITGGTFSVQTSAGTAPADGIFVGTLDEFPGLQTLLGPSLPGASVPYDYDATWREGYVTQSYALGSNTPKQVQLIGKTFRGVPHAVSRFLEEVGCRWLFPGPEWEVVPSTPTLVFGKAVTDRPAYGLRSIIAQWSGMNVAQASAWAWHNRVTDFYGNGSSLSVSTAQGAWTAAIRDDPAWFDAGGDPHTTAATRYGWLDRAQGHIPNPNVAVCSVDADCKRSNGTRDYGQFCECGNAACTQKTCQYLTPEVGSTEVADQLARYTIKTLKSSKRDVESIEPADGLYFASESPQALAVGSSFSNQVGWFANEVGKRLRLGIDPLQGPDPETADKMVGFIGYSNKAAPPSFPLEPNVWVDVLFAPDRTYQSWEQALAAWGQAVPGRVGIRDNLSYYQSSRDVWPGGWASYSPGRMNDPEYLQSFLQMGYASGARSVKLETSFSWGLAGMGYWLFAKTAWNPNVDIAAYRTEVLQRTFGAAYGPVRTFLLGLDPQKKDVLPTKLVMKGLFLSLQQAAQYAAGDAAVELRIRELKAWLHYQTLFWKLYRTYDADPVVLKAAQAALAQQICNLGWRMKDNFMLTLQGPTVLFAADAARQFGVTQPDGSADPAWYGSSPSIIWKTPSAPPTDTEIDTWFNDDRDYFSATVNPGQNTYENDLVPVSLPHTLPPSTPEPAPWFYTVRAPLRVATYSFDGTLKVHAQTVYPSRPDVKVTIRDMSEAVVASITVPADNTDHLIYTGNALTPNTAYFLDVDPSINGTSVFGPVGTPLVAVADRTYRPNLGAMKDAAVYVPKNVNTLSYVWTSQYNQYFNASGAPAAFPERAAIPPRAHQLLDPTNTPFAIAGSSSIRSPNDTIAAYVPTTQRGKIWTIQGLWAAQLWFYSIPPYYSAPASLMVPRSVALADGLTIRTQ